MNSKRFLPLVVMLLFCSMASFSQYILNGTAKKITCNCYTLTEEQTFQSGSVWNSNKINLANSFDFWFNVNLGCKDADGADGIVFILQPISTSIGTSGGGMGFEGVKPSIGIALDTWQNTVYNDPAFDHISIQANGVLQHNNDLAGPVPISASSDNVEDCKWHVLRIVWNAATQTLQAYFDDVLRVQKQINLVSAIFNNDPNVYWGFTGATGGSVNLQQFCTALNPNFRTNASTNNGCEGVPIQFRNASESFAPIISYNWSFGDGTVSTDETPPPHVYAAPGKYDVNLKIRGQDGCEKDSNIAVTINANPTAAVQVFDTCSGFFPRVQFQNHDLGVSYQWTLDGAPLSATQQPVFTSVAEGAHQLQVTVSSNYACGQPAKAAAGFVIKPKPQLAARVEDGCIDDPIFFEGVQNDTETTIVQWQWRFGDGGEAASQTAVHRYKEANQHPAALWAEASNGCRSDTVYKTVSINRAVAFAGRDTVVIKDVPFQLHGTGNGTFLWAPATYFSNPFIADPVVALSSDELFILTVTTAEGCVAQDTVLVKTFVGPAVYVPSAFTPNGDGKNETLRPVYVGINELKQFAVFNRWGQVVFNTVDKQKGWDGRGALSGTYVWMVRAVNSLGQLMVLKGTVTLIR